MFISPHCMRAFLRLLRGSLAPDCMRAIFLRLLARNSIPVHFPALYAGYLSSSISPEFYSGFAYAKTRLAYERHTGR